MFTFIEAAKPFQISFVAFQYKIKRFRYFRFYVLSSVFFPSLCRSLYVTSNNFVESRNCIYLNTLSNLNALFELNTHSVRLNDRYSSIFVFLCLLFQNTYIL